MNKNTITTESELIETFSILENWEDKYKYIIDLGNELPPMNPDDKTPENEIHGCQSQVWMTSNFDNTSSPIKLFFTADSDSQIVKGLLGLVIAVYNGKSAKQIITFNIESFFDQFNLRQHLTARRGNGLRAVIQKCREIAEKHLN